MNKRWQCPLSFVFLKKKTKESNKRWQCPYTLMLLMMKIYCTQPCSYNPTCVSWNDSAVQQFGRGAEGLKVVYRILNVGREVNR